MALPGWQKEESPFHAGERLIQTKLGIRDRMETFGRKVIREALPEQHRKFYAQLPYLIVGTLDTQGDPWASILVGNPGFVSAIGDRHLRITTRVLVGDPLISNLSEGIDIGLLGIELHTRRRNRANGIVSAISSDGFDIQISQAFGNCPKYIQTRQFDMQSLDPTEEKSVYALTKLRERERTAISAADTFFISTAYLATEAKSASGVDVSHRGGKAGFVHIDGDTLTIPDFAGNGHFNTFGNIEINPRAGLLFIDFDTGDLIYLTGRAEVVWDEHPEVRLYPGAERLLKVHVERGYRVEGSLPQSWSDSQYSPFLEDTGPWNGGDTNANLE